MENDIRLQILRRVGGGMGGRSSPRPGGKHCRRGPTPDDAVPALPRPNGVRPLTTYPCAAAGIPRSMTDGVKGRIFSCQAVISSESSAFAMR